MRVLRSLDLFSGIGGFALALKPIATTVAFCDVDSDCRKILSDNMRKGLLDQAPIFDDVRRLDVTTISQLRPNLLCAGFPCQDISVANVDGVGIQGVKSGLFSEIVRILAGCDTVQIVFLENSSNIVNNGLKLVHKQLKKLGFRTRNIIGRAKDVGAPHKRTRWFLLGVRQCSFNLPSIHFDFNWQHPYACPVIPVPYKRTSMNIKRCSMLGNSVVPACVANVWNELCGNPSRIVSKPWSSHTFMVSTKKVNMFPTPTYQCWHQYRIFTDRSTRAIGNFIFYLDDTFKCVQEYYAAGKINRIPDRNHLDSVVTVNPEFIEWLMGYPRMWTQTNR